GLPDLKGAAESDEGRGFGDSGMFGKGLRQDDTPLAIEGELLAVGEDRGRQALAFLGKLVESVEPRAHLLDTVDAAALDRRGLERAEGDDAGEALAGEGGAKARGNGHPPLAVHLV